MNPTADTLRSKAAQTFLASLGLYRGEIDGLWGARSISAASAWWLAANPEPLSQVSGQLLTPYGVAQQNLGVREIPGKQHHPTILRWYRLLSISIFNDEVPWCSTFVNFCALEAAYERTGSLLARSWLDVGIEIDHITKARPGDVIIFERGSDGWSGHVTFYVSHDSKKGIARCLGGNQSNEVNIASYPLNKLLGIRRLRPLDALQGGSNKI